jgi:hypothetical protein
LKKIAAILLILLLAFNWYGYRFVISAMKYTADRKLEASIDNSQYDESQLIELRVAMNLPYQQRFTEFERHYGEIEIDGTTYTYVKRKVEGDVLVLKCIPNSSKQQLKAIDNDLTRANTGTDTDHSNKQQSSFAKNFWSEYDGENALTVLHTLASISTSSLTSYSYYLPEVNINTPHQPPEC